MVSYMDTGMSFTTIHRMINNDIQPFTRPLTIIYKTINNDLQPFTTQLTIIYNE